MRDLKLNNAGQHDSFECFFNNQSDRVGYFYSRRGLKRGLSILALLFVIWIFPAHEQQKGGIKQYPVENALGLPVISNSSDEFKPMTSNVKVFGSVYSAESCSYDPVSGLIVVVNRGVPQSIRPNDAWISLLNHDGSVHTVHWLGMQGAKEREALNPPFVLNDPFGSDIVNGILYVADSDGGTGNDDPRVAVIRSFDMKTGVPLKNIRVENSTWLNDIEVTEDGTIYATQTGDMGNNPDPQSWRVWKVDPNGKISVFAVGAPLKQPNGIAFDPDGNIVVANYGDDKVLTFSKDGKLIKTETAAQPGGDGLVIMPDGTKYVCSVKLGGVSRIRPGQSAELIANNIPSAASMCYDPVANQLVIPMNQNNGLAFVPLK